ncbi:hypothetical protein [Alistipes timonensis]|uniref:hypothetical protein n=1 Tax=Alistipes timonensis TaxID=1465754 RepID=UPI00266FB6B9|nr:hypothetical protein [Alistipes timonensis]
MKSEKARELIEKYAIGNSRDTAPSLLKRTAILCVELAEQEAESRMRRKAIEAFDDMWFSGFEPDYEYHRENFIKKLNAE